MRVRGATPNDWPEVAELLSASSLPLDGAHEHLTEFVVAEQGARVVGCAALERYGDVALLRSVAVAPSERGKGTGSLLVERCIQDGRVAGIRTLVLLTTTAERYFPRFGFEVTEREAVPEGVRESAEFRGACPQSATVMRLVLRRDRDGVAVRRARLGDARAIAAIYNVGIRARTATFETRERMPDEIEAWIASERYPIFVAEREGRVVGWAAASAYRARECYAGVAEFSVYVEPGEQRRGAGSALMGTAFPALERAGFWKVVSRVFPENAASRALCRRQGFREVGMYEKHARLDGAWRDVVIVERLLGVDAQP